MCVAPLHQQDFSTRSTAKREKQPRCCEPLGAPRRAQAAAEQKGVAGTDDHSQPVSRQPTELTGQDRAGVIDAMGNLKHRVDSVCIYDWKSSCEEVLRCSDLQNQSPFCWFVLLLMTMQRAILPCFLPNKTYPGLQLMSQLSQQHHCSYYSLMYS